ncbi:MAG: hypothetical protein ACYT04_70775, partial [Nostoc sp.]
LNPECLGITQRLNKKSYKVEAVLWAGFPTCSICRSELGKHSEVCIRISLNGLVKHVRFVSYKLSGFSPELLTTYYSLVINHQSLVIGHSPNT